LRATGNGIVKISFAWQKFLWLVLSDTSYFQMSSVGMESISALQFGMNSKNKEIQSKRKLLFDFQAEI